MLAKYLKKVKCNKIRAEKGYDIIGWYKKIGRIRRKADLEAHNCLR